MPSINIHLNDNTGAEYIGDEQVVFVPGQIEIAEGYQDANNCCYIASSDAYKLKNYFGGTDADGSIALIKDYLGMGYDVVYCNADPDTWTDTSLDFLLDKDSYNIKFLTTGTKYPIDCGVTKEESSSESNEEDSYAVEFDYKKYNLMVEIAKQRKDCIVPASVGYTVDGLKEAGISGDILADCILKSFTLTDTNPGDPLNDRLRVTLKVADSKVVEEKVTVKDKDGKDVEEVQQKAVLSYLPIKADNEARKFSFLLIPNTSDGSATKAYLRALSEASNNNQDWLPIANSSRGQVVAVPDLKVTKYHLDKEVIKDQDSTSFNGIVTIKPYGNVIWGDRTLIKNGAGVSASSYISLMLVVCDISKRAYQASVRYTYESNNSVTWLNYKSMITPLLDQMVSSGVLQSYKIEKVTANSENTKSPYNTMICKITVYPNLPVENFEIYINLENADLTVEND